MSSDFEEKSKAFCDWFRSLPGTTFHEDIRITDLRSQNAGRGIVATADIEPDTVLFTIPRKDIISLSNSELAQRLPALFAEIGGGHGNIPASDDDDDDGSEGGNSRRQDSWTTLILIMVYEYLRGDKSHWKPYFDVLPTCFDTPMFWSDEALKELQASPVLASIGREDADRMIRSKILSVIEENVDVFFASGLAGKLEAEQLMELAHRMGSTIMAYAFDLEKDEDDEDAGGDEDEGWVVDREDRIMMGMVPMADILNADAEFNAHINHSEEALVAVSLRKISAGEEILNYYGPLSNGQLCRRYGYTTPNHSRYDVAEVSWEPIINSILSLVGLGRDEWEKISARLKADGSDNELEEEDSFILERHCDDPDEFGRLVGIPEFRELPPPLTERLKAILKVIKKVNPGAVPDKKTRDKIILSATRDAIEAKLAEYGTSLEQDIQRLQDSTGRLKMALDVRIGEKTLLHEVKAWVDRRLEGLDQKMETDEPTAKRQRRA